MRVGSEERQPTGAATARDEAAKMPNVGKDEQANRLGRHQMVREEGIGHLNTSLAIRQTLYALFRIDYMVTTASSGTSRVIVIAKRASSCLTRQHDARSADDTWRAEASFCMLLANEARRRWHWPSFEDLTENM